MTKKNRIKKLQFIAIALSLLIISLPISFAEQLDRTYDANGNLISDGKYYREYNGLNQLVRVRLGNTSTSPVAQEYVWHPIEERIVIKRVFQNGVLNYTVYYPNENFVQIVNSSGTYTEKYVYQEGVLVAQINTDGQKQAIHSDHEGSNTLITDSNGNVVENTFYSPYGEILEGGKESRKDYEGKEFDLVTNRLDFGFRQIDPQIHIWDKPDTLIQNPYDPQFLNRFMFERGNPQKNKDDDGHWVYVAVAAGIGATLNLGFYLSTHDTWTVKGALSYAGSGALIGGGAALGGVSGAATAGAAGRALERWGDEQSLTDGEAFIDVGLSGAFSGITAGLGAKILPQPNKGLLKRMRLGAFGTTPTGLLFTGNNLAEGSFSTLTNPLQNRLSNLGTYYAYNNQRENLIQQVIREGSSRAVFGNQGGSDYSSKVGAYVSDDGRVYPTNNPNFRPNPKSPRVCVSGCKK